MSNCDSNRVIPENSDSRRQENKKGSSTVCDRNTQKKTENRNTELKKTGIAPIVKCPTKTVGGKQCRSTFTIHRKVCGFQQEKVKYSKENVEIHLKRTKHQCPYCGSSAVTVEPLRLVIPSRLFT